MRMAAIGFLWLCLLTYLTPAVAEVRSERLLRMALTVPMSADPHLFARQSSFMLSGHVYPALVRTDSDEHLIPSLAKSWAPTAEGGWSFHLRSDIVMQNGASFTARDVVFSLCRAHFVGGEKGTVAGLLKSVTAVEVNAPDRITLHFDHPYRSFPIDVASIAMIAAPQGWAHGFTAKKCAGMPGYETAQFDKAALHVGSGPYQVTSFAQGHVRLDANPHFRIDGTLPHPPWQAVELVDIHPADRARALVKGHVDIAEGLPFQAIDHLRTNVRLRDSLRIVSRRSTNFYFIQFNHGSTALPLSDVRVRHAINVAIDRAAIAQRALSGQATPTAQVAYPTASWHESSVKVAPPQPEEARAQLASAGVAPGTKVSMIALQTQSRIADAIAKYLGHVGLDVDVQTLLPEAYFARLRSGAFDLAYRGITFNQINPAEGLQALLGGDKGGLNYGGFKDAEIDRLLQQALLSPSDSERAGLLRAADRRGRELVAIAPILFPHALWGMRADLAMMPRLDRLTLANEVMPFSETMMVGRQDGQAPVSVVPVSN